MKRFNVVDFDCEKRKEIYRLQRRCIHLKENILGFDFRYPDIFSKRIKGIYKYLKSDWNPPETEHNMDNTLAHHKKLHRTKVCGQILTKNLFAWLQRVIKITSSFPFVSDLTLYVLSNLYVGTEWRMSFLSTRDVTLASYRKIELNGKVTCQCVICGFFAYSNSTLWYIGFCSNSSYVHNRYFESGALNWL